MNSVNWGHTNMEEVPNVQNYFNLQPSRNKQMPHPDHFVPSENDASQSCNASKYEVNIGQPAEQLEDSPDGIVMPSCVVTTYVPVEIVAEDGIHVNEEIIFDDNVVCQLYEEVVTVTPVSDELLCLEEDRTLTRERLSGCLGGAELILYADLSGYTAKLDTSGSTLAWCSQDTRQLAKEKLFSGKSGSSVGEACSYESDACEIEFNKYLKPHAGSKHWSCSLCPAKFVGNAHLIRHMRTHTGERPFSCPLCVSRFTQKCALNLHMKSHSDEKPYVCSLCPAKFHRKSYLELHTKTHTGEKSFLCSICGASFLDKSGLRSHMFSHSDQKPFLCSVCAAQFSCKKLLNIHMERHTGEKPFLCAMCGKAFLRKNILSAHILRHMGLKPFSCRLCAACFTTKVCLNVHMRMHTGEKPYSCSLCSISFCTKSSLNRHVRSHKSKKVYLCSLCSSKFTRKNDLKVHIKSHR